MTPDDVRRLALALPGAEEGAHMGHADFRIGGRIFATLGFPDPDVANVMLDPEEQAVLVEAEPDAFVAVSGGWGAKGATRIILAAVDEAALKSALTLAWRRKAPKKLLARFDAGER